MNIDEEHKHFAREKEKLLYIRREILYANIKYK